MNKLKSFLKETNENEARMNFERIFNERGLLMKVIKIIGKIIGTILVIPFALLLGVLVGIVRFVVSIVDFADEIIVSLWD